MQKYLVEITYRENGKSFDMIDTFIVTADKDYNKADYKIKQYLTGRFAITETIKDIRVVSFDIIEKFTVK